jgi:FixJ family two-component response regulator
MTNINRPLVVIVDDDVAVCRAMSRLFMARGYEVHTFGSGRDLLDELEATPAYSPKCVILDIQMPGMNGLEVQIRLAAVRAALPVIFVASAPDAWMRAQALAAGAVEVFEKPLLDDMDTFLATLDRVAKNPSPR